MTIRLEVRGGIAVVTIDRPPVNSVDLATRTGRLDTVATALAAASVEALVLWGGSRLFCAGADIEEFAAAIAGTCLGGGLDVALACHVRLCAGISDAEAAFFRGKLLAWEYFFGWELPRIDRWLGLLHPIGRTVLDVADAGFG